MIKDMKIKDTIEKGGTEGSGWRRRENHASKRRSCEVGLILQQHELRTPKVSRLLNPC